MKDYLVKKKELLAGTVFFEGLSGLVWFLYGLPSGPFVYTSFLTMAGLILYLACGYPSFCKKSRELKQQLKLALEGFVCFREAENREEALYQQALTGLEEKREEQEMGWQKDWEEAKRYYALWSHQIKTPLAAVRLLLQEEEPDTRALEQEILKAEQYVEMALQYQRMAGNTTDLVLAEYDLSKLVKQAVKKTAPLFIYKKLGVEISPMDEKVTTDEKWLVFVLEQLLTNAVKYTGEGRISIYMQEGELVIADTGIGILQEDLPRVFEWGYTGFNGRLDKHSTGIGLSLCRQMLHKLGHEIRLESEVGKGTRVFLLLKRDAFAIE